MTNLKICEERLAEWGYGMAWYPLDPQPCCANCCFKYYGMCTSWGEIFPGDDFYCSYWELRECQKNV